MDGSDYCQNKLDWNTRELDVYSEIYIEHLLSAREGDKQRYFLPLKGVSDSSKQVIEMYMFYMIESQIYLSLLSFLYPLFQPSRSSHFAQLSFILLPLLKLYPPPMHPSLSSCQSLMHI